MAVATAGVNYAVWMDQLGLDNLQDGEITTANSTTIILSWGPGTRVEFHGSFTYNGAGQLTGGVLRQVREYDANVLAYDVHSFEVDAVQFLTWIEQGATQTAFSAVFAFDDTFTGSNFGDRLFGYNGRDTLWGGGGGDTLAGDAGEDFIRGEAGDDRLFGGDAWDNMHGNIGNDTLNGDFGDDWVVGGQNSDVLNGDAGADIIYGNLAIDTCHGGDGNDTIVAGQENDLVTGGAGNDWLGGDRGSDTLSGGAGADLFRMFVGAGGERITDFNRGEGDRILVEGGANWTVSQAGADVLVDFGGGDVITLVNVSQASLTDGWIVRA